jgi:hypothetical protein
MKPWREGWPGGMIRPHYVQSKKIKGKLGVAKIQCSLDILNKTGNINPYYVTFPPSALPKRQAMVRGEGLGK